MGFPAVYLPPFSPRRVRTDPPGSHGTFTLSGGHFSTLAHPGQDLCFFPHGFGLGPFRSPLLRASHGHQEGRAFLGPGIFAGAPWLWTYTPPSRPSTAEAHISFVFFSSGYWDVSVRRVRPPLLVCEGSWEFPHSGTLGSKPVSGSPRSIAGNRALHRLRAPRSSSQASVRFTSLPKDAFPLWTLGSQWIHSGQGSPGPCQHRVEPRALGNLDQNSTAG